MAMHRKTQGFTLIEIMIAVAIIGIITAIALPSYRSYVLRGKLVGGTNQLSMARAAMEQYYQDNRTYATVSTTIVPPCVASPWTATNAVPFNVTCGTPTATAYTITATGTTAVEGATYTIDQTGAMATTKYPTSWGSTPSGLNCWVLRKGDSC